MIGPKSMWDIMKLPVIQSMLEIRNALLEVSYKAHSANSKIQEYIACHVGCDGCCHRMVQLTLAEAVILMDNLKESGNWKTVINRVKHYADEYNLIDRDSWFKMRIPCPLLDSANRKCLAYLVRPAFCSTHFAIGDSDPCDPWYMGSKSYTGFDRSEVLNDFYETVFNAKNPQVFGMMMSILPALLAAEKMSELPDMNLEELIKVI